MPRWVDEVLNDPVLQQYKPSRPWQAAQHERDLLFLHYRLRPDELRHLVPEPLELVTFDGSAWVSLIAFRMGDVRLRLLPVPPPGPYRRFAEIDLAAVVQYRGRAGLYFLSIEGASRLTSWIARRASSLPYRYAPNLRLHEEGDGFRITSGPRWARASPAAEFEARYAPWDPASPPDPGSPVDLLAGRYSAFTFHRRQLCEFDEIHEPWVLHEVHADVRQNTLLLAAGIDGDRAPEFQHFSHGRRIVSWLARPVDETRSGLAPVSVADSSG